MSAYETIKLEGPYEFDLVLTVEPDTDSNPHEFDWYDESDIQAWRNNEWEYVGYVITARRNGIELGSASIWGTEYGTIGGREYGSAEWIAENYYYPDLIIEVTTEARDILDKLTRTL